MLDAQTTYVKPPCSMVTNPRVEVLPASLSRVEMPTSAACLQRQKARDGSSHWCEANYPSKGCSESRLSICEKRLLGSSVLYGPDILASRNRVVPEVPLEWCEFQEGVSIECRDM